MRLSEIPTDEIIAHMSDPRVIAHMPLATAKWDEEFCKDFVTAKEASWERDGLGHWAILLDGKYIGWGGFQKEDDEWDFGLVLKPEHFGLGMKITATAIAFAKADDRIPFVTFLLPPSRKNLGALKRLGAKFEGEVVNSNSTFLKFSLQTE